MADFNFYLNRQGARGRQGEKGEQGFSPIITVNSDTLSEYILQIQTQDNVFLTANLREHKEDLGGTYIRYNRETGVMYAGDADIGTESNIGMVRFATDEEFNNGVSSLAVTPTQVQTKLEEYNTSEEIDNLLTNFVSLTGRQTIAGNKIFTDRISTDKIYNVDGNHTLIRLGSGNVHVGDEGITTRTIVHGTKVITLDTPSILRYDGSTFHKVITETDIATTSTAGVVIPDGTTIKVDSDGTISAIGGGSGGSYTAGNGIDISNGEISIDNTVVPTLSGSNAFSGSNSFTSLIIAPNGIRTGNSATIHSTQTGQAPIVATMAVRHNGGVSWSNDTVYGPIIQYSHPLENTQGVISIGSTGSSTVNSNKYYAAGKLRLIAPEALTRYDDTNEYDIVDSGNISNYLPTATSSSKGLVQPDGITIDVDGNGVISVNPTGLTTLADTDASNFTNTGKVEISSYGMPSNKLVNLSLGVSGSSYTAPTNGYLLISFTGDINSAYAEIVCYTGSDPQQNVIANASATTTGGWGRLMCPCKAGDVFRVYYGGTNFSIRNFEFVYAVGSESEAN